MVRSPAPNVRTNPASRRLPTLAPLTLARLRDCSATKDWPPIVTAPESAHTATYGLVAATHPGAVASGAAPKKGHAFGTNCRYPFDDAETRHFPFAPHGDTDRGAADAAAD